ncbi:hypothetical protein [Streptomyces luteireticuli]|uniref:Uncharacterized protein n=1 Tax=Streptomyces luteireticuli TaxID=173858 RepID=A0ABN0Z479_9ACTN
MTDGETPGDLARMRLSVYLESLRARMPRAQYELLTEVLRMWAEAGGGTIRLKMDDEERELFTQEVQHELLVLMGLIGAQVPGHEDRADHVVARLGDGEHAKGVMSLVPPDVARDDVKLRAMRDKVDAVQKQRSQDLAETEAIARASGMLPEGTGDDEAPPSGSVPDGE